MPIHLIWGDDAAASEEEIERLINEVIDPAWNSINCSRLNGDDSTQAKQALEAIRTPPFGNGGRLIVLKKSPFCNNCPQDLAHFFELTLDLIPNNNHLVLNNLNKPDGRLKTTKAIQKLIHSKQANEKSFILPAVWDEIGQIRLVKRTAQGLNIEIEEKAALYIVEAIGNDSSRINSEIKKLALHANASQIKSERETSSLVITEEAVHELIDGKATNSLQVADCLLNNDIGEAISRVDALLEKGEPALKIIATLTSQIRGLLWVSLLESKGEKDVSVIAKAAGINNPKRIYFMRKQLQGKSSKGLLDMLSRILDIEAALKKGVISKDAFRDGLTGKNTLDNLTLK